MKNEPTISDVLDALQVFATHVDQRFNQVDARLDRLETRMSQIEERVTKIEVKVSQIEERMTKIEATMPKLVTQEYFEKRLTKTEAHFDEKFLESSFNSATLLRKEDRKLAVLVDELLDRKVLDQSAANRIFAMEPFAQTGA